MNFKLKKQKRKLFLTIQNIKTKEICFNGMVQNFESAIDIINEFYHSKSV
jgi:hypothetical protein